MAKSTMKLLASSDGEIEVAEVPDCGLGKGGIGVIGKGVENGRIDVVERRVWGREELPRRARRDGDVVRDKLVVAPVTGGLGRSNEISHGSVRI
jgi:hypothetical protein